MGGRQITHSNVCWINDIDLSCGVEWRATVDSAMRRVRQSNAMTQHQIRMLREDGENEHGYVADSATRRIEYMSGRREWVTGRLAHRVPVEYSMMGNDRLGRGHGVRVRVWA